MCPLGGMDREGVDACDGVPPQFQNGYIENEKTGDALQRHRFTWSDLPKAQRL